MKMKINKNKYRLDKSKKDFWCKKLEKCKIKIKKISPTPKSIIHKKPIKISASSSNIKKPKAIRYIPATYHNEIILTVFMKKIRDITLRICNKKTSFNIIVHIKIIF